MAHLLVRSPLEAVAGLAGRKASASRGCVRSLFLRSTELTGAHFEAGQKLDIALIASRAALADAESLLWRVKLRPVFGQLVLGFCFFSLAGRAGVAGNGSCRFCFAISYDVESGELVGCPGPINLT